MSIGTNSMKLKEVVVVLKEGVEQKEVLQGYFAAEFLRWKSQKGPLVDEGEEKERHDRFVLRQQLWEKNSAQLNFEEFYQSLLVRTQSNPYCVCNVLCIGLLIWSFYRQRGGSWIM